MDIVLFCRCLQKKLYHRGTLLNWEFFIDNMFNELNLACDLMEPFRILVDRQVYKMNLQEFGKEEKSN